MSWSGSAAGGAPSSGGLRPVAPLFITHFSESPRTAIGVQTTALMSAASGSRNAYFATPELFRNTDRRACLENPVICRTGRLQTPARSDLLGRLGLGWWSDGVLRRSRRPFVEAFAARTSIVYVSPLNRQDALRMRVLVALIGRPFVVHLWDSLSGPLDADPDLVWLIEHAARVLTVSENLRDDVERLGAAASILRFGRPRATARATPPGPPGPLRIALIGLLDPYLDGVLLLDRAVSLAAERGFEVEMTFVGPPKLLRRVRPALRNPLPATGFLSDAARDEALATCHAGFLPGPSADPFDDMRSRYSIPSRSLDFLAVGLPTIGTLHPQSAAHHFSREAGIGADTACDSPEQIVEALLALQDAHRWQHVADDEQQAFQRLSSTPPADLLSQIFDEVLRERS